MSVNKSISDRRLKKRAKTTAQAFDRLYKITARLRAPDGCPWDKEQTPESMRGDLLEECYEAVEAIDENAPAHICEELGDVFLNTAMIAYMNEQVGNFSTADALNEVSDKIIRRHPHVFGNNPKNIHTSAQVLDQWAVIKSDVEGRKKESAMDEVSNGLPPLKRAQKIQKKAAKAGFDWSDIDGVWDKVQEELTELKEATKAAADSDGTQPAESTAAVEEELGDVLFSLVNLARHYHIDAEQALISANKKFVDRYKYMEQTATNHNEDFVQLSPEQKEAYWDEAKKAGL